jgi:hypothetical protein
MGARAHEGILDRADARFWDELAGPIGSAGEEK